VAAVSEAVIDGCEAVGPLKMAGGMVVDPTRLDEGVIRLRHARPRSHVGPTALNNMKTVILGRDATSQPRWNPGFWRFATEVGFHPELCDPGAGQQKGSVENLVKWVKTNFLPGRSFVDDEDLAHQSMAWERDKAVQVCQAHGQRPVDLLTQERAAFGPLTTTPASRKR
jgi:hypothetical protein